MLGPSISPRGEFLGLGTRSQFVGSILGIPSMVALLLDSILLSLRLPRIAVKLGQPLVLAHHTALLMFPQAGLRTRESGEARWAHRFYLPRVLSQAVVAVNL